MGSALATALSTPSAARRLVRHPAAGLAVVAFGLRVPAWLADRHLTFDDGVFGSSAVAMRHGAAPFRDVFSSQGPLFLPLVRLADLAGLETRDAPRLLAVAAGVALAVLAFAIASRFGGQTAGVLAGATVAVTGSVLWTTGPLAADGTAAALSAGGVAVALASREHSRPGRAVASGLLLGAAFAIKSLFAVPAGLAVAWVFLGQKRPRHLVAAAGVAGVLVLLLALPWGLSDVWDQSIDYHLDAAGERTPGTNLKKAVSTLADRDLPVLVLAAAAGASVLARRSRPGGRDALPPPVLMWLGATAALLLLEHPLWRPHLVHLAVPAAVAAGVAVGRSGRRVRLAAVMALVAVLPYHAVRTSDVLWPAPYPGAEAAAVADLRVLPDDAWAISDEPGLVWRAGRRAPADLVDTSILRIAQGRITAESVVAAASEPEVCAVLVWSRRFASLGLDGVLDGYRPAAEYGDRRVLYVKSDCDPRTTES